MGCGKSKHDVATGNIISKIRRPSFRSLTSSKSKKSAADQTDTNNVEAAQVKAGESLVDKTSDVKGKEEEVNPAAKETQQDKHKLGDENVKPVVAVAEKKKLVEEKPLLQQLQETAEVKENNAAVAIIAEEKKPVEVEKPLLQETTTQAQKQKEEPIVVQEEKLVVIKEEEGTVKVQEEKAAKEGNLAVKEQVVAAQLVEEKATKEGNLAVKEQVEAAQLVEEKATKEGNLAVKEQVEAAQLVEKKAVKEDDLALKKDVEEAAKTVSVDEAKPPTETGKEENPAVVKETKADSAAAAANELNISSEMK